MFDHAVALRVEGGGGDVVHSQATTEDGPDGRGELCPSVRRHGGRDAVAGDPGGNQGVRACSRLNVAQWDSL